MSFNYDLVMDEMDDLSGYPRPTAVRPRHADALNLEDIVPGTKIVERHRGVDIPMLIVSAPVTDERDHTWAEVVEYFTRYAEAELATAPRTRRSLPDLGVTPYIGDGGRRLWAPERYCTAYVEDSA